MRRWRGRVSGAVLAAVTVALLAEWRQSHRSSGEFTAGWHQDTLDPEATSTAVSILSRSGRVDVFLLRIPAALARPMLSGYLTPRRSGVFALGERHLESPGTADWTAFALERRGAATGGSGRGPAVTGWRLRFPHWLPTALAAVATALTLRPAYRRWKLRHAGRCERCGYDLRSSTERCPECGEPFGAGPDSPQLPTAQ